MAATPIASQPYDVTGDILPHSGTDTQYPQAQCANDNLIYTEGLTNNANKVKSAITSMEPAGMTNITIGVAWGMEALSQNPPLTGGRGGDTRKVMVVMTDGQNTRNRWKNVNVRSGYNWVVSSTVRDQIDARTKAACTTAKDAGIEVYTVNLVDGNSALLSDCATDPGKSANAIRGGLESTFRDIATQIMKTYLAG